MMRHHAKVYRNNQLNKDVGAKIQWFNEIKKYIADKMTMTDACMKVIEDHHLDIDGRALYMQFRRYLDNGKKRDEMHFK